MITGPNDALLFRPEFIDPSQPTGLWWVRNAEDVDAVRINAVCKSLTAPWSEVNGWTEWLAQFPYILLAIPPGAAQDEAAEQLTARVPIPVMVPAPRDFLGCETVWSLREEGGLIRCDGRHMRAGTVHFDYPSVGATENVMMAAALLKGRTVLSNVAREPEITDLQNFLNAMGARISGAGTHTVTVEGVDRLRGVSYCPMPDRIVAGTLLAAAAATGGDIRLTNVPCRDLYAVFTKMREMGCEIDEEESAVRLRAPQRLTAFQQLQTQPHPGFPTDMQAQMLALAAMAKGTSVVVENVFENRFAHAGDLNRMGANVLVNGRTAVVQGVDMLYGTHVTARDLRGGAALVIAGLAARGETLVERAELIDRGYERLEEMLGALGAEIRRDSV